MARKRQRNITIDEELDDRLDEEDNASLTIRRALRAWFDDVNGDERELRTDGGAGDGPPPKDFDYGEKHSDGQYENHPTTDEGEFVQAVRRSYVHVDGTCDGATTKMNSKLAESFARDPTQYGKTFCASCGDYYLLDQFVWKGTDIRLDTVGIVGTSEGDNDV